MFTDSVGNMSNPASLLPVSSGLATLANQFSMDWVDLNEYEVDLEVLKRFPPRILFREKVLPLSSTVSGLIRVAISDPYNIEGVVEIGSIVGQSVETVLAEPRQIEAKLHELLGVAGGTINDLMHRGQQPTEFIGAADKSDEETGSDASVIRLVNELLCEALTQGASDVHLEPHANGFKVRFRVDGQMRWQSVPDELYRFRTAIVSRLKIMAKLNIAEKRLPQDGRIKLTLNSKEIDVRISIIPMLHGEGVVMRLLDQSRAALNLDSMYFPPELLVQWKQILARPNGMVLVTGPTGSGKTTTLYASLAELKDTASKIVTIEDPVEYQLDGISQIPVHSKIGLTFATGLRAVLRHDPDVVLIGEIRDNETAASAIQAALTGHLVFSTLHTNDAASAFTRLTDMGIEPYLTASTLHAVLAQRLVRRLCLHCRVPELQSEQELVDDLHVPQGIKLYRANGCRECHGSGYRGRLAIFELLQTDRVIRKLCGQSADAAEIRRAAVQNGMISLRESGWRLVIAGETTIQEVLRTAADADLNACVAGRELEQAK